MTTTNDFSTFIKYLTQAFSNIDEYSEVERCIVYRERISSLILLTEVLVKKHISEELYIQLINSLKTFSEATSAVTEREIMTKRRKASKECSTCKHHNHGSDVKIQKCDLDYISDGSESREWDENEIGDTQVSILNSLNKGTIQPVKSQVEVKDEDSKILLQGLTVKVD